VLEDKGAGAAPYGCTSNAPTSHKQNGDPRSESEDRRVSPNLSRGFSVIALGYAAYSKSMLISPVKRPVPPGGNVWPEAS